MSADMHILSQFQLITSQICHADLELSADILKMSAEMHIHSYFQLITGQILCRFRVVS